MESDLIARLLADAPLSALVGGRINPLTRPRGEPLDALTITPVAPGRTYTTKGASGTHGSLTQFDIWAAKTERAFKIYGALLAALEKPAVVGATSFEMSFLQSRRVETVEVAEGTIGHISADFLIWWNPA